MDAPPAPPWPLSITGHHQQQQQLTSPAKRDVGLKRPRAPAPPDAAASPHATGPRRAIFDEWLSTSVRHATHHYKAAVLSLARQNEMDLERAPRGW